MPRTRKAVALLAFLILHAGRRVDRVLLAETLWPDSPGDVGATNLRQALAIVRRSLGPIAGCIESPTKSSVLLNPAGLTCDLLSFDEAIRRKSWEEAVEIYAGALLEDAPDDWTHVERQRLERACLEALGHLADQADSAEVALRWAERAARLVPLDEPAQRRLYRAYARSGNLASARIAFQRFRTRLWQISRQVPDPETLECIAQLTTHNARPAPETISRFLTKFVGREASLSELVRIATSPHNRLLTILGPGGLGKTRIAVELANRVCPDGIPFVDFAPLPAEASPEILYSAIVGALHLRIPPTLTRREAIRVTSPTWLLLDNAETVLASVAKVVTELLSDCPSLHLIVTSRQALGLPGETRWVLPPLDEVEAGALLRSRASNANPNVKLTDAQVTAICVRLEGIPLAVELAAGRFGVLTPTALQMQLETRRLPVLRSAHSVTSRHTTLESALEGSWDSLSAEQQQAVRRLTVFAGGWTLEAAQAVAFPDNDLWDTLDRIDELVSRSFILVRGDRFSFLDTVREFVLERLNPSERLEVEERHVRYFSWLAEQDRELSQLQAESDNLRAALGYAAPEVALQLYTSLGEYFLRLGHFEEGRHHGASLIRRTPMDHPARPWAFYEMGRLAQAQRDDRDAEHQFEEGLACAGANHQVRVALLGNLGLLARERKDFRKTQSLYREAVTLAMEIGFTSGVITLRIRLAILAEDLGNPHRAFQMFEELLRDLPSPEQDGARGLVFGMLGGIARRQGKYRQALELYQTALPLHERFCYQSEIARVCLGIGLTHASLGQHAEGRPFLLRAIAIYRVLGEPDAVSRAETALSAGTAPDEAN